MTTGRSLVDLRFSRPFRRYPTAGSHTDHHRPADPPAAASPAGTKKIDEEDLRDIKIPDTIDPQRL